MKFKQTYYLLLLFASCGRENISEDKILSKKNIEIQIDSLNPDIDKNLIEHIRKPFTVGDINNDKKTDSAFVIYDRVVSKDGTIEKECVNKNCAVRIEFTNNIPKLTIDQSLGIIIKKTEDLNDDKANELILFSEWFRGQWNNISVWTFKNGKWKEIAKTTAFISEDEDFEKRILKEKSKFYLLGDDWDDEKGGLIQRSIKIEIEK